MSSAEHASRAYVNEFFTLRFDSTSPSSGKHRSRGGGRKGESEANVIIPKTISAYFQDIRSVRNRLFLSYLRRRRSTRRRRTSPPSRGATRRTPTVSGTFCPPMSICPSANRFFFFLVVFSLLSLLFFSLNSWRRPRIKFWQRARDRDLGDALSGRQASTFEKVGEPDEANVFGSRRFDVGHRRPQAK